MTVAMFVLMLSIPVVMIGRQNLITVVLVGLWGFFLGLTPIGPDLAVLLNQAGAAIAGLVT